MVHNKGVTSVKVNGPGMSFAKCTIAVNFTDGPVRPGLDNLKPITAAPQIDIAMGRFAARINFPAVFAF